MVRGRKELALGNVGTALVEILQVGVRETGRRPRVYRRRLRWSRGDQNEARNCERSQEEAHLSHEVVAVLR